MRAAEGTAHVATDPNHAPRGHASVALAVSQRNAHLTASQPSETPPCYCGDGLLANTFLGIQASFDVFLHDELAGLGAFADITLLWAPTTVQTDLASRRILSVVSDLRGALAYQWRSAFGLVLAPRLGWGAYHFPLSDGPFPGLAYRGPFLGLDTTFWFAGDTLSVGATLDWLVTIASADDAVRLGQQTGGSGIQAAAGLTWVIDPVEVGLRAVYTNRGLNFSGQTFLFTPQRFDNVALSDQQVQLLLSVGTRFW